MESSPPPEDPIAEIIRSLHEREAARRRAVDLAFDQVSRATDDDKRRIALDNLGRMIGVQKEFHEQFPEVFPNEGTNQ